MKDWPLRSCSYEREGWACGENCELLEKFVQGQEQIQAVATQNPWESLIGKKAVVLCGNVPTEVTLEPLRQFRPKGLNIAVV
jgi:hypothetical protein